MYVTIQNKSTPSLEEPSASVANGVYVNAVTDTGHYDVPRRMGNMTETGNGGNRSAWQCGERRILLQCGRSQD